MTLLSMVIGMAAPVKKLRMLKHTEKRLCDLKESLHLLYRGSK